MNERNHYLYCYYFIFVDIKYWTFNNILIHIIHIYIYLYIILKTIYFLYCNLYSYDHY